MAVFLALFTILMFCLLAIQQNISLPLFTGFGQVAIFGAFLLVWAFRAGKVYAPPRYIYATFGLSFFLLFGGFLNAIPTLNIFVGTMMTVQFAVLFIICSGTNFSSNEVRNFCTLFIAFVFINSAFAFFDYVGKFPDPMRDDAGVQGNAGFFASGLNIGAILLLAMNLWVPKRYLLALAAVLSLLIFLTAIKKAMIINIIVWMVWAFARGAGRAFARISLIACIAGISIFISIEAISKNVAENVDYLYDVGIEGHVRLIMYSASLDIALDHFPFGSGAGSFGSISSITSYFSPLYNEYGVTAVPTNTQYAVDIGQHTLLDTYWPHIIAEAGVFGAFLAICLFLVPMRESLQWLKSSVGFSEIKFCAFISFCIPLSLFLEGFALYTPEAPSFIIFFGCITGYCYRILRDEARTLR
jgi:hypothetical protein